MGTRGGPDRRGDVSLTGSGISSPGNRPNPAREREPRRLLCPYPILLDLLSPYHSRHMLTSLVHPRLTLRLIYSTSLLEGPLLRSAILLLVTLTQNPMPLPTSLKLRAAVRRVTGVPSPPTKARTLQEHRLRMKHGRTRTRCQVSPSLNPTFSLQKQHTFNLPQITLR